jgi:hypothetical protein
MVRYFYAWIPFVLVGTIFILSLPWLGVIALMAALFAVVVAVLALARGIIVAFLALSHAGSHRLRQSDSRQRGIDFPIADMQQPE